MRMRRALSLIVMMLVIATSSITMAIARNQPRAIGSVDLCTGYGMVSVSVDAQGKPTGPLMPCPDATQALAALTDAVPTVIRTPGALTPQEFQLRDLPSRFQPARIHRHSRAPPVTA